MVAVAESRVVGGYRVPWWNKKSVMWYFPL